MNSTIFVGGSFFFKRSGLCFFTLLGYEFDHFRWRVVLFQVFGVVFFRQRACQETDGKTVRRALGAKNDCFDYARTMRALSFGKPSSICTTNNETHHLDYAPGIYVIYIYIYININIIINININININRNINNIYIYMHVNK